MKAKVKSIGLILTASVSLIACSSPSVITTKDGQQVMTADKPEINEDDGFVHYEKDGKKSRMNSSEIRSIEEVK